MADEEERPPKNIVALDHREWLDRPELTQRLDIDAQDFDNMLEGDRIQQKITPSGPRYRYVGPVRTPSQDGNDKSAGVRRTEIVAVGLSQWTEARQSLARLESKLEASREDVRRAVGYAQKLEEECDRLADVGQTERNRAADICSELNEERGRRRELEEQYQFVVEKLEEMSSLRGRYHLERGRRESAEEHNRSLSDKISRLEDQIGDLTKALEEARQQGFRIELGDLLLEFKR